MQLRSEAQILHLSTHGVPRFFPFGLEGGKLRWMANRNRRECAALCRTLLEHEPVPSADDPAPQRRCAICGGSVAVVETILPRGFSRPRLVRET
jgi:hypothetical protein